MATNNGFSGVSDCYVFKSRLQEYAQKVGIPTPVYETSKEGPSHEPSFRSTVIVNDVRYDSLPGFFNRKAAEQSAAEVALMELAKSGELGERISQPIHETGLCKNLLQEYAQKMNFAIPLYQCHKEEAADRMPRFSCTVEIGGIRYIGAVAKTKKEAEIKAARTALLALQSSRAKSGSSLLTVLPSKKRPGEPVNSTEEVANVTKAKKARVKKLSKKRFRGKKVEQDQVDNKGSSDAFSVQVTDSGTLVSTQATSNCEQDLDQSENKVTSPEGVCPRVSTHKSRYRNSRKETSSTGNHKTPDMGTSTVSYADATAIDKEVNVVTVVTEVASVVNNSTLGRIEA